MAVTETEILAIGAAEPAGPGTSWGAIIAGAVAAVATSLILMLVGSGLGLTLVSPWSATTTSAATFAVSGMIWLVVVQWLSSAMGGYLTGRLRTRWIGVDADEAFFRDTAHGFVAWALSTIIVAALLTSAVTTIVGGAASKATMVAAGAAQGVASGATQGTSEASSALANPTAYFVDMLFRRPPEAAGAAASATSTSEGLGASRDEAGRILITSAAAGQMADSDKAYLAQLVARETGLSADDSQKRVDGVLAQIQAAKEKAKSAADVARKAGATVAILTALSLVIGAFIASVAAALGGHLRDTP
jgi:hypothetical protein